MEQKHKELLFGAVAGFIIIAIAFSNVPYTVFDVSSFIAEDVLQIEETTGPRLFVGELHIHHYILGIIGMAVAYFIAPKKYKYYLIGFSAILIVDQLPWILGQRLWGI